MGDRSLQRWSQSDWTIFFGSRGPTIREIIECLGLSYTTTDRDDPKFSERESRHLSNDVQKLSQTLPTDPDALFQSASDPSTLNAELDRLLENHGPAIWGENADRRRLLKAAGTSKTNSPKELFFEISVDKELLKKHLHRWIYKKAYTRLQTRRPTRQSAACDLTTNSDLDPTRSVVGRPASVAVEPPPAGALTVSSATPPAQSADQLDGSTKRKADPRDSVPNADSDATTRKRLCQDAAMSAEQTAREPASTSRQSSGNITYYPTPHNTCYSTAATYAAVRNSAATSSGRPSVPSDAPSQHALEGTPNPANSLTSIFVAVNRVPISGSSVTDSCNMTSTHNAPSLSGTSVLPMASYTSTCHKEMRGSLSTNSQRLRRREDATSAQMSHSPTPPAAQVSLSDPIPGNLSRDNAARAMPSSRNGVSDLHRAASHNIDEQNNSSSNRMPGSREVTFQQCDLLCLLLGYLFPRNGEQVEESALLHSLEQVWASHEQDFRHVMERLFDCHRKVLLTWISERRKTSQLRSMIDRQPSAQTLEMVDRVLIMNDLRVLRLKWKELKVYSNIQDMTPQSLLCRTFAIMTKTEGTEVLFKEGLDMLKETSPEVLRPDDLTISIYT